jgi:hypothetical protein
MSAAICGNTTPDVASRIRATLAWSSSAQVHSGVSAVSSKQPVSIGQPHRVLLPARATRPQRSRSPPPPIAGEGRRDHKPVTDPCARCPRSDIPDAGRSDGTRGTFVHPAAIVSVGEYHAENLAILANRSCPDGGRDTGVGCDGAVERVSGHPRAKRSRGESRAFHRNPRTPRHLSPVSRAPRGRGRSHRRVWSDTWWIGL